MCIELDVDLTRRELTALSGGPSVRRPLPGGCLPTQLLGGVDSSIDAPLGPNADFDRCHVEPVAVPGSDADLPARRQMPPLPWREGHVQRRQCVRVTVVLHP